MAYRCGDRHQMSLMPASIEEYVSADNPVRAYDAFVEALNFHELGIAINPDKVGNSEYDPRIMLKLLVYGYSYGVKGSRKLERECHHNLAFIWLIGGLRPDHKTIAEFRRNNKKALQKVLRQCARMCIKLDLVAGNVLFVDGTKIRANAGRHRSHDHSHYEKRLNEIDGRIEQLLADCEAADQSEEGTPSYVSMSKELSKAQRLKETIKQALEAFKEDDRKQINHTDTDCAIMRSIQGSHAGYNVQSVVDEQHGLIVHAEATKATSDVNQFADQIDKANSVLEKPCEIACADAGYADTEELEKIDRQGIKVIVPSQRQALLEEESPFSKSHFVYDKETDTYTCPEGHTLRYSNTDKGTGKRHYLMVDKKLCHQCKHYGQCTEGKNGRKIVRLPNEEAKKRFEAQYQEESSQEIYVKRKTKVEHPFGHIKRNLKTDGFLLRKKDGVQAETSLLATCFNLARMITILGVHDLIEKMSGLQKSL
ncbi:MAG: IS1182 family transposase [Deltaproteobacteria bacterium]